MMSPTYLKMGNSNHPGVLTRNFGKASGHPWVEIAGKGYQIGQNKGARLPGRDAWAFEPYIRLCQPTLQLAAFSHNSYIFIALTRLVTSDIVVWLVVPHAIPHFFG